MFGQHKRVATAHSAGPLPPVSHSVPPWHRRRRRRRRHSIRVNSLSLLEGVQHARARRQKGRMNEEHGRKGGVRGDLQFDAERGVELHYNRLCREAGVRNIG